MASHKYWFEGEIGDSWNREFTPIATFFGINFKWSYTYSISREADWKMFFCRIENDRQKPFQNHRLSTIYQTFQICLISSAKALKILKFYKINMLFLPEQKK